MKLYVTFQGVVLLDYDCCNDMFLFFASKTMLDSMMNFGQNIFCVEILLCSYFAAGSMYIAKYRISRYLDLFLKTP